MRPGRPAAVGPRGRAGLTLVEILVALLVLAILAVIGLPAYLRGVQRARETAAVAYLRQWPPAQEVFFAMQDRYAASLEELIEAGFLGRIRPEQIGYDFGLALTLAGRPGAAPARTARLGPTPPWRTPFSLVGTAWAKAEKEREKERGGRKAGERGGTPEVSPPEPAPPAPGGGAPAAGPTRNPRDWEGWANPRSGSGRYFYVDRTKVVRYAEGGPAGKTSQEIPE